MKGTKMKKGIETTVSKMEISAESTASAYTDAEIREAQDAADEIYKEMQDVGRVTFISAAMLHDFHERKLYKRLNCRTIDDWIRSIGYAPSTFRKYMSIYKSLTVRLGIPKRKYETVDIGKVLSLKILAEKADRADYSLDEQRRLLNEHIQEARELDTNDLIASTNEKIRMMFPATEGEEEEREDDVKAIREQLNPGTRLTIPLTKEQRDMDPQIHAENLVELKGIQARWWYSKKTGKFLVEVK